MHHVPWFGLGRVLHASHEFRKPARWFFPDPVTYTVDKIGWRIGVCIARYDAPKVGIYFHDRDENVPTSKTLYICLGRLWVFLKLYNWKRGRENPGQAAPAKEVSK